jgi:hypothetical protein
VLACAPAVWLALLIQLVISTVPTIQPTRLPWWLSVAIFLPKWPAFPNLADLLYMSPSALSKDDHDFFFILPS